MSDTKIIVKHGTKVIIKQDWGLVPARGDVLVKNDIEYKVQGKRRINVNAYNYIDSVEITVRTDADDSD